MSDSPKPALQAEIEAQLATAEPDVEVLLAELAGDTLRLYIDHPDGVSLALCERVTHQLAPLRERDARDGHKSFTGELVGATDEEVTIAIDDGVVAIPYSAIARSNLVPGE
jgi:ribosome maturation factor RimP